MEEIQDQVEAEQEAGEPERAAIEGEVSVAKDLAKRGGRLRRVRGGRGVGAHDHCSRLSTRRSSSSG